MGDIWPPSGSNPITLSGTCGDLAVEVATCGRFCGDTGVVILLCDWTDDAGVPYVDNTVGSCPEMRNYLSNNAVLYVQHTHQQMVRNPKQLITEINS
jgi:hypothetical protein